MDETIELLKKMVDNLPDLSQLVGYKGNHIEYNVPGTSIGFNLWHGPGAAVQRTFLSKDTEFPYHVHHLEHEYTILVSGSIKVVGKGVLIGPHVGDVLMPGGCSYFDLHTQHKFIILEDSWVIGITVPPSDSYP